MPDSEAKKRWNREHTTRIVMNLNHNTDKDVLDRLKAQDSIQGYIKRLIRADIAKDPPAKPRKKNMTIEEAREMEQRFNAELELFKKAAHD